MIHCRPFRNTKTTKINIWNRALNAIFYFTKSFLANNIVSPPGKYLRPSSIHFFSDTPHFQNMGLKVPPPQQKEGADIVDKYFTASVTINKVLRNILHEVYARNVVVGNWFKPKKCDLLSYINSCQFVFVQKVNGEWREILVGYSRWDMLFVIKLICGMITLHDKTKQQVIGRFSLRSFL